MRIGFPYTAQDDQLFHSLPIAARLSALYPRFEVVAFARDEAQRPVIDRLLAAYPGHRVRVETLTQLPFGLRSKLATLAVNVRRLRDFQALVLPERTSLILRRLGVTRPKLIHNFHGSSGHDRLDDGRLARFDLLLAPSQERLDRIEATAQLRPGRSAVIGYVKFDAVERLRARAERPFDNARPTVLYNPHDNPALSSWPKLGPAVLDWFAASRDFNLIFAPHVRLFDPPEQHERRFDRWRGLDHVRIDLGSAASIDMTHLMAGDIYLGDGSSQAFEWTVKPRPMIFLDPRGVDWRADADYRAWSMGPVVPGVEGMAHSLAGFSTWQPLYRPVQTAMFARAFPPIEGVAPARAAHAIADYLTFGRLATDWEPPAPMLSDWLPAPTRHPRDRSRSAPAPARTGDRTAG